MDYTTHAVLQARILDCVAFPFPGDLPKPGIELGSPALQVDSLPAELLGRFKGKKDNVKEVEIKASLGNPTDWPRVKQVLPTTPKSLFSIQVA